MSVGDVDNPFRESGRWLKGALHTHTSESDGILSPADVVRAYRELGFHFVVFTDHGKVTRFDGSSGDFLTLPGIELGLRRLTPDKYWHFIGVDAVDAPTSELDSPVDIYEYVRAKSRFCVLAHPYWSQLTGTDLTMLEGLASLEVWNTGCEIEIGRGYAEYEWDWCLSAGRRMTGVAVDDSHGLDDLGKGWVLVKAAELSADAILRALSRGCFYSSCGPEIRDIRLGGGPQTQWSALGDPERCIHVTTSPCRSISFISDAQQGALVTGDPKREKSRWGTPAEGGGEITSAAYVFKGREKYVRVQCVDGHGRKAWSNPFYPLWPRPE